MRRARCGCIIDLSVMALLEHDKLVTAEAGDEVLRAQHFAQPIGDHAQQLIAAWMTKRIVDLLELIEIDEQQRRQRSALVRSSSACGSISFAETDPVRQPRQFVETRHDG